MRKPVDKLYWKSYYQNNRKLAIEQLGGKCVECGSVDNLEFDHIDENTKKFEVGRRVRGLFSEEFQIELKKCQLLCKQCHRKKSASQSKLRYSWNRNTWHHGLTGYGLGCRCDICKIIQSTRKKELRKKCKNLV